MTKKSDEFITLLNFLKSGLSTRELDNLLGHKSGKTKGWVSWDILKKYKLKNSDKGKLFLYSEQQSGEIIGKIVLRPGIRQIDKIVKVNLPNNLEKYKNTFVIASSEKSFYNIFSGETRNIIQSFFNPKKKIINKCQYKGCKSSKQQIDTVHFSRERPEIFMECAKINRKKLGNKYQFNVYNVMKCFLMSHFSRKSICFLCKIHHTELHRLQKGKKTELNSFKKRIIFD